MSVLKNKIAFIALLFGLVALCQGLELPKGPQDHPQGPPGGPAPPMEDRDYDDEDDEEYDDEDDEEDEDMSPEESLEDLIEEHYEVRMECQDMKESIEGAKKNGTAVDKELQEEYTKCQKYLTELRGKVQQMTAQLDQ